jgi:hypothetical protein
MCRSVIGVGTKNYFSARFIQLGGKGGCLFRRNCRISGSMDNKHGRNARQQPFDCFLPALGDTGES